MIPKPILLCEEEELARRTTIDEELSHSNDNSCTSDSKSYNNRMLMIDQLLGSEGFTAASSDRNSKTEVGSENEKM